MTDDSYFTETQKRYFPKQNPLRYRILRCDYCNRLTEVEIKGDDIFAECEHCNKLILTTRWD